MVIVAVASENFSIMKTFWFSVKSFNLIKELTVNRQQMFYIMQYFCKGKENSLPSLANIKSYSDPHYVNM